MPIAIDQKVLLVAFFAVVIVFYVYFIGDDF